MTSSLPNLNLDQPAEPSRTLRRRIGLYLTIIGAFIFFLGAQPGWFGLDRSPVIGFVQITVFLVGLGMVAMGGYLVVEETWNGNEKSIAADIGARVLGTGYVIAVASGLADVFGLGTRPLPATPFFGFWQARGVFIGELAMALGLAMMLPLWRPLIRLVVRKRKDSNGK